MRKRKYENMKIFKKKINGFIFEKQPFISSFVLS